MLTDAQRDALKAAGVDLSATPTRSAQVTRCLRILGIDAELVKGRGYFWFSGPATETFYSQSAPVCYLHQLTIEQWLNQWYDLATDSKNY